MIKEKVHEKYMQRCIELAKLGLGNTAPNPMVGSVIVHNNKVIGEGYHKKYGESHAEVNAINSVKDKSLLKKSTIYVNLEPCSHYGKTPPCANLIANVGIPNVVIGGVDTAAHVSGGGIKILKEAGSNVLTGVLEKESRELNRRFFTFQEKKRPYIILKWAQTKDGFIDIKRTNKSPTQPTWITNEYSKVLVHKWRSEEQAILVGTNTVLNDNPSLTTRNWEGKNPTRIILDREMRLADGFNVFNSEAETLLITDIKHLAKKKAFGNNIGIKFVNFNNEFYSQLFQVLIEKSIQSVIIEGGATVLNSFIRNELWDEARIFIGEKEFKKGLKAPTMKIKKIGYDVLGNSNLTFNRK